MVHIVVLYSTQHIQYALSKVADNHNNKPNKHNYKMWQL